MDPCRIHAGTWGLRHKEGIRKSEKGHLALSAQKRLEKNTQSQRKKIPITSQPGFRFTIGFILRPNTVAILQHNRTITDHRSQITDHLIQSKSLVKRFLRIVQVLNQSLGQFILSGFESKGPCCRELILPEQQQGPKTRRIS